MSGSRRGDIAAGCLRFAPAAAARHTHLPVPLRKTKEFQFGDKQPVVWHPDALTVGARWDLQKTWRAVVADEEELQVGALETPVQALRVEYEKFFDAKVTQSPGWYPAGTRWFARGVGMVREDLEGSSGPSDAAAMISSKRHLELTRFTAPWKETKSK